MNKTPPNALIKTWVWLLNNENDPEIKTAAANNLTKNFGSLKKAQDYYEQHIQNN